jgi:hypothetical protein
MIRTHRRNTVIRTRITGNRLWKKSSFGWLKPVLIVDNPEAIIRSV